MPSSRSSTLIDLVRSGKSDPLVAIADALDSGDIDLASTSIGIGAVKGVGDDLAGQTYRAFQSLTNGLDERAVSTAIRTAVGIRSIERLDRPEVEICWTGPDADGPLVTANAVAIKQLLQECRDTGEILLVGYSLTVSEGSFMNEVIGLMVDASKRGARIQVILHQDDDGKNKSELLDNWSMLAIKPEIYTWDPPPEHPYTKLHAKTLVVDRLQMLVTSANFTFHGLESNIELGLLVRNQQLATAVHERFDRLISSNVLKKWKDAT